jgi:phage protein D
MPNTGQGPPLYSSRPVLTIGGQPSGSLAEHLLELVVEETVEGLFHAEATFGNFPVKNPGEGYLYFDRKLLDFGKPFEVQMGAGIASATVFSGRLMALEGRFPQMDSPQILVKAEDRLQDLRMSRRTRTFEKITDAALFDRVAKDQGLRPQIDVSGPTYACLAQVNQSDLQFLRERAQAADAELWVDDTTLSVQSRAKRKTNEVTLIYGEGLHEFSAMADLANQFTGFSVTGWDVAAKQALKYRATSAALAGEANGDVTGSAALQQAIGAREQTVVHALATIQDEAQALAEAGYRRWARRFVTGTGLAEGDGRIQVGTRLTLQNVGPLFNGKFYVTAVRHIYDPALGYRTWFAVERPGIGQS